jgi:hypothetical protein
MVLKLFNPNAHFTSKLVSKSHQDVSSKPGPTDTYQVQVNGSAVYLTVQAGPGGTTSPSPGTYAEAIGAQVQVKPLPNSGYALDKWQLDGVDSGSGDPPDHNFTVKMSTYANHTLKALFVPGLTVTAWANTTSGSAPLPVQFNSSASDGKL